jgi:two-component system LytT family response regulator
MPEMDGFEFLDHFHQRNFNVVFITAYTHYAITAIKENALDYLLKPIDSDDLVETIEKLKIHKSSQDDLEKSLRSNSIDRIAIPVDGKLVFLTANEIIYCESDGNYCKINLVDGKPLFVSKKLKDIQNLLPASSFYRVHNSYIVNLKKVREYLKTDGYVILENRKEIPVSRNKKSAFLDKI